MKLPILAYGHPLLREPCAPIDPGYPALQQLIADMWQTMYHANGCGLAAPQVARAIQLFVVDSKTTFENLAPEDRPTYFEYDDEGIKEVFINAHIIERSVETWDDKEGCLSIPAISQTITRPWRITIRYYNEHFEKQVKTFTGATARMIQHEYEHTAGILYLDHLKPLARKLLASKLNRISNGQVKANYPMQFNK